MILGVFFGGALLLFALLAKAMDSKGLVNLGNATGHPSRIMDGSFANQVLAQIHLYAKRFADLPADEKATNITVEVLPKHLDEQVATLMVKGFDGVITRLTEEQASYIGVTVDGPFKTDSYKY